MTPTPTWTPSETSTVAASSTDTPTPSETPTGTLTANLTSTATPQASLILSANLFNESDPPLRIEYEVFNGGEVQLEVYNVAGEVIRHLVDSGMAAGTYTSYWDGKDDRGDPAASGLYLLVLTEPGRMDLKKVLVLKP